MYRVYISVCVCVCVCVHSCVPVYVCMTIVIKLVAAIRLRQTIQSNRGDVLYCGPAFRHSLFIPLYTPTIIEHHTFDTSALGNRMPFGSQTL